MPCDFYISDYAGDGLVRYGLGDLVDITEATGQLPVPNLASPFRIARVTNLDRATAVAWLSEREAAPGETTARRLFYLDSALMSNPERNFWNANRCIETTVQNARKWVVDKSTGQPQG